MYFDCLTLLKSGAKPLVSFGMGLLFKISLDLWLRRYKRGALKTHFPQIAWEILFYLIFIVCYLMWYLCVTDNCCWSRL